MRVRNLRVLSGMQHAWWICRPGTDGDKVLLEDVDVPAHLGQDRRDGSGGQVAGQHEEGALRVPLAVNLLLLRKLALLSQTLQFPVGLKAVKEGRRLE